MTPWRCGINGCGHETDSVEALITHQTTEHTKHECQVCGTIVPDGYFAIRHAVEEHTRAEYVRAYDADSAAVRHREEIKEQVETEADLEAVVADLEVV